MKALDDNRIVELYLLRDETAIKHTSEKYGSRLRSLAYGIVNDQQTAEECENDTYMEAWNTIPPQRPNHLKAFLGRIARQLSINRLEHNTAQKRAGSQYQLALDELSECISQDQEDFADTVALRDSLNQFLHTLPIDARRVFIRRYWHLHSISEIAADLSMSESKVKSLLMRTRKKLKQHLTEGGLLYEK